MERLINRRQKWAWALGLTARIWSVASLLLVVAFMVGAGFRPSAPRDWLAVLFFPIGISAGMILAWGKERLGGSITAASLVAFYVVRFTTTGSFPQGWAWLAFAAPGFLFLLSSVLSERARTPRA
jgi:hypothetical protein